MGALRRAKRREKTIGRGTPCGCPSQGKTPRTVQIIGRYRKSHTSLATGGRFLVRKRLTIGRGTPCGCPSQGKTPRTVQIIGRYRKFSTSLATGGRFLGRKKKTIGRGAPCGRPSWAIVASEFRCDCPEDVCGQHWPVSRLILVFYDHNLRWQRCTPCASAALRVLRG